MYPLDDDDGDDDDDSADDHVMSRRYTCMAQSLHATVACSVRLDTPGYSRSECKRVK